MTAPFPAKLFLLLPPNPEFDNFHLASKALILAGGSKDWRTTTVWRARVPPNRQPAATTKPVTCQIPSDWSQCRVHFSLDNDTSFVLLFAAIKSRVSPTVFGAQAAIAAKSWNKT
jgi:hypothetical protein